MNGGQDDVVDFLCIAPSDKKTSHEEGQNKIALGAMGIHKERAIRDHSLT